MCDAGEIKFSKKVLSDVHKVFFILLLINGALASWHTNTSDVALVKISCSFHPPSAKTGRVLHQVLGEEKLR